MPEGSHEPAAALLPIGVLHSGNLLDDFGEDASSQLQGTKIQDKKKVSLLPIRPSSEVHTPLPTILTTKKCHKKNTATLILPLIFRPST